MLDQVLQRLSRRDVGLFVLQVDTVVRLRLLTLVPAHREATPLLRPERFTDVNLKRTKKNDASHLKKQRTKMRPRMMLHTVSEMNRAMYWILLST